MLHLNPIKANLKGQAYPFVLEKGEVKEYWDELEPLIERSVQVSFGTVSTLGIQTLLFEGEAICMGIARDGELLSIIVVRVVPYPDYQAARIIAAAGRELKEGLKYWYILEEWAYMRGATQIEVWCRPAMARLAVRFGFGLKLMMLTKVIRRVLQ